MTPVGVSVDVDGHVWVVDQTANAAFKLNRNHALLGIQRGAG
jgi:streptogramin lyase